jgi:hypothetical protein
MAHTSVDVRTEVGDWPAGIGGRARARGPLGLHFPQLLTSTLAFLGMNEVVDRILFSYAAKRQLDKANIAASREKIRQYIQKLAAAGQKDKRKLAKYGLAYLKELHEGRDPRFTGC